MKIESIDVNKAVDNVKRLLKEDKSISPSLAAAVDVILLAVGLLSNRLGLNSKNSSKPPSTDTNKTTNEGDGDKKRKKKKKGGQNGHKGTTLDPVDNPDKIEELNIDRRTLPKGGVYTAGGYIARQEFNIKISRFVVEYRAEKLVNQNGKEFVASFPGGISHRTQYGTSVKSRAVYFSVEQMIPYERIQEQFKHDANLSISTGTLVNFKCEAAAALRELKFDVGVKHALKTSELMHSDETGINIAGKRAWLHGASNNEWSWFEPHKKRGSGAMDDIGILPFFLGVLCHDHWKPYYLYKCFHSLCNAHHLRELKRAQEQDNQAWAGEMLDLLLKLNKTVEKHGGALFGSVKSYWKKKYFKVIAKGEKESPLLKRKKGQKGKIKQTKSRNLLDRLNKYSSDVLRFIEDPNVPFTNNQGERDIRMTKVQQKISGCFASIETAKEHCIIKSYLSTCKKNGMSASEAMSMLFDGKLPDFIQKQVDDAQVLS